MLPRMQEDYYKKLEQSWIVTNDRFGSITFQNVLESQIAPKHFNTDERKEELKAMFLEADIDFDGKLDDDEFCNFFFNFMIKFGNDVIDTENGDQEFYKELMRQP